MSNLRCIGTIAVAAMALTSTADAREGNGSPVVRVHLENYAGGVPAIVNGAQNQVAHIYQAAGVQITWSTRPDHADCAGTLTIHVLILSLGMEDRLARNTRAGPMVLAQANREGRRIHVFWSRVDAHVSRTSTSVSDALGVVIAHELGHVLLPSRGHSHTGIMQENYMVHSTYLQRFTADQATAIRAFVSAHAHER